MIKNVVCGISGGVDSAVAAYLLKRKGFNVTGVFMKNWDIRNEKGHCTSEEDQRDAEYVCNQLQIPFKVANFVKDYWNHVFSQLVQGYEDGVTPNPDVLCNKHIKFGAFFKHATHTLGADAVATGHYAQNSAGNFLENFNPDKGSRLLMSRDKWKDQTLFLCQIGQQALRRTMFPVGDMLKSQTKEIAQNIGLQKIVDKKESMGICFIGSRNFNEFIEEYIESKPGNFINVEDGSVVGSHTGTHHWTVGQRCHIGGLRKAFFVAKINAETQDIFVASGTDHPALFSTSLTTSPAHWIYNPPADLKSTGHARCDFKFQHIHKVIACDVEGDIDGPLKVTLDVPMRALTPGQYAVFYQGEECFGGAKLLNPGPSLYDLNSQVHYNKAFS